MLKFLLEKEFKQIFRNSFLPRIILFMPLMMMLIMPWAANQEIRNIHLCVVDNNMSSYSERLVNKVTSSGYFKLTNVASSYSLALKNIESGASDLIMEIPSDFEKDMTHQGFSSVALYSNAVNGTKGSLGASYLSSILSDFSAELSAEHPANRQESNPHSTSFQIVPQYRFNPHLDYKVFMVPALMVMLLTMLAGFLPALNIVSEKETGTIEQINVTPVSKPLFILAKLIPYWCIGFAVLTFCMFLGFTVYGIFPKGSLLTIYLFASIYILVVSGMGLVISNYSNTMQQAMFVMYFFMMILILMSGLFTPITSMPQWAQNITVLNPLKYFIQVMRQVYLKGSGFVHLIPQLISLSLFAFIFSVWAILSYKKSN